MNMLRRRGFTLIELLVVVAIIALLIAILLPSLAQARELSRRAVGASRLQGIGRAVSVYATEWDDIAPVCFRSFYSGAIGGSGTSGALVANEYAQKIQLSTIGNQPIWRWGAPAVLSKPAGGRFDPENDFALQKLWVSAGPEVKNAFNLGLYGNEANGTFWAHLKGKSPGGTKAFSYGSYFTFIGEPGNTTASKVYFQDNACSVEDSRFDDVGGGRGKFSRFPLGSVVMQDIVLLEDPSVSAFYQTNYLSKPGGYLQESWGADAGKPLGAALGLGPSAHCYVNGNFTASDPGDVAGGNALFADGSVTWNKLGGLEKVFYRSPGTSKVRTLFLAKR